MGLKKKALRNKHTAKLISQGVAQWTNSQGMITAKTLNRFGTVQTLNQCHTVKNNQNQTTMDFMTVLVLLFQFYVSDTAD